MSQMNWNVERRATNLLTSLFTPDSLTVAVSSLLRTMGDPQQRFLGAGEVCDRVSCAKLKNVFT